MAYTIEDDTAPSGGYTLEDDTPSGGGIPGAINTGYNAYMRGSGMVGRALTQAIPSAILGLPALAMDAVDSVRNIGPSIYNAFADNKAQTVEPFQHSRAVADLGVQAADTLGLPKPETKMGQGLLNIGTAALSAGGGAGFAGSGARLLGAAPTAARTLLGGLSEAPAMQAAGAGGSVLATDLAREGGVKNPLGLLAIGMVGGAGPGSMATLGERAAGGAGQLFAPFRSANEGSFLPSISREVIAGKTLNKLATTPGLTPQIMDASAPILPGSYPTISQASRDPGLMSAESGIRSALDNGQITSGRFAQRNSEQNTARNDALDQITMPSQPVPEGGAPQRGTLQYAQAKRDAAVDQNKNTAFEGAAAFGLGDTSPVLSRIQAIRSSPQAGPRKAVQDAMNFAEERLTQPGVNLNDPETLYSIRKDLGLARDGKYNTDKSDLRLAKGELQTVIGTLDNVIDSAAPGYRRYMDLYRKRSIPLDQQEAITGLRDRGRVSVSDHTTAEPTPILTMGKFGVQARKAIASGALGRGPGNGNLSDSQLNTIISVTNDLDRGAAATASTIRPAGSDTFKNLSIANVIGRIAGDQFPDTSLGQMSQTIAKPLSWLYTLPDEKIGQLLVEASLDPQLAGRLMRQASAHEIQSISTELAHRAAQQARGAGVYGTPANQ